MKHVFPQSKRHHYLNRWDAQTQFQPTTVRAQEMFAFYERWQVNKGIRLIMGGGILVLRE